MAAGGDRDGHAGRAGAGAVPAAAAPPPLESGQVRVAVRAAGLNFRDVLIGLGMYPGGGIIGSELAGVVLETGPGVTGLAAGDRVAGITTGGGFGPVAVTDARLLAPIPDGWSFARAASVPVAFATAWYGLADLAGAASGAEAAGARGGRRGRDGRGDHRPASRPGGLRHGEPRQARRAGRAGPGRGAHRVVAGCGVRGEVPGRDRRRGRGYRAERAGRGAHRRLAAAPPPRRRVHRDGQDRPPRPGPGCRGTIPA